MKIRDITDLIESYAPLSYQESYDNSGLIVGHPDDEVESALLCVDATESVLDEAEAVGAGVVISHHPIIFHPIKHLTGSSYVERVVERAIRKGIALYACHTNLDSTPGGMSFRLASQLGIEHLELLVRNGNENAPNGFGVIGSLPAPVATIEFLQSVKERLQIGAIRHSPIVRPESQRIALCTGAGASLIAAARAADADLYLAADFRYNDFLDAEGEITVADIGHFESEYCAIDLLYEIIRKKIPTFALRKSRNSRNPINYLV